MNDIAKAANVAMAGVADVRDNHLILHKFLEAYNKLQDPAAWREEYRKKQAAGVRYEFNFGTSLEPIWRYRLCEFLGEKEEYREVVETPNPDLGGLFKSEDGKVYYPTHAGGGAGGGTYPTAGKVYYPTHAGGGAGGGGGGEARSISVGAPANATSPLPHLESRKLWLAQREANKWQPIETAPKDGTVVDLWCRGDRCADCVWHKNDWREWRLDDFDSLALLPVEHPRTHWMPKPAAPKDEVTKIEPNT